MLPLNLRYSLFSLGSSSSFLRLLRLTVPSILPSIFPSITCIRRQFLCQMWPIQLVFLLFTVRSIFLSCLALCKTILSADNFTFPFKSKQENLKAKSTNVQATRRVLKLSQLCPSSHSDDEKTGKFLELRTPSVKFSPDRQNFEWDWSHKNYQYNDLFGHIKQAKKIEGMTGAGLPETSVNFHQTIRPQIPNDRMTVGLILNLNELAKYLCGVTELNHTKHQSAQFVKHRLLIGWHSAHQ